MQVYWVACFHELPAALTIACSSFVASSAMKSYWRRTGKVMKQHAIAAQSSATWDVDRYAYALAVHPHAL